MKRITRIIRPIICMAVLLFAMTTAVMGCYQKEAEPIDIPGRTPSGTSAPQPSATPAGEVIPSVDRQTELAEARAKNPDTVAWLYIPGAEVDDPVMQAEDNGYYLKLDENGEYAMWGCYYAHCENEISGRDIPFSLSSRCFLIGSSPCGLSFFAISCSPWPFPRSCCPPARQSPPTAPSSARRPRSSPFPAAPAPSAPSWARRSTRRSAGGGR